MLTVSVVEIDLSDALVSGFVRTSIEHQSNRKLLLILSSSLWRERERGSVNK